jgi:quercetin dioxygenase-like cupin family protein
MPDAASAQSGEGEAAEGRAAEGQSGEGDRSYTEVFEDPLLRYRYRFSREDDVLHVEMWADPGGGVTIEHFHPAMEERFEVLDGEVTFKLNGEKTKAVPGERAVAKPGDRHTFENTGTGEAHLRCEAEPPLQLQEFLQEAAALSQAGLFTRRGFPKSPEGLLVAAEFVDRYRETVVFTDIAFPPPALQGPLFGPLARLQRRRGAKGLSR